MLAAEHPVAGQLDLERQALAALRLVEEARIGTLARSAGVQALERPAFDPELSLAVRDEEEVDPAPLPGLWDRRLDSEPPRRPEWAEVLSEPGLAEVEGLRLLPRDPIDRAGDEDLVGGDGLRVDHRREPLRGLTQARAGVLEVANHERAGGAATAAELS